VRYQDEGHAVLLLQYLEQLTNTLLSEFIEARCRLVKKKYVRLAYQRKCNQGLLELPSG
jgi:hypothetical protein